MISVSADTLGGGLRREWTYVTKVQMQSSLMPKEDTELILRMIVSNKIEIARVAMW